MLLPNNTALYFYFRFYIYIKYKYSHILYLFSSLPNPTTSPLTCVPFLSIVTPVNPGLWPGHISVSVWGERWARSKRHGFYLRLWWYLTLWPQSLSVSFLIKGGRRVRAPRSEFRYYGKVLFCISCRDHRWSASPYAVWPGFMSKESQSGCLIPGSLFTANAAEPNWKCSAG